MRSDAWLSAPRDRVRHTRARGVLSDAGGALRIVQSEFTPDRLATEISALSTEPAKLAGMAEAARQAGRLDAAERLADLVVKVAGI